MAKKSHIEITGEYVDVFNGDPWRITPRRKPADVINQSLSEYLSGKTK